jgi:membrane-bound lytic murein transglycosylase D
LSIVLRASSASSAEPAAATADPILASTEAPFLVEVIRDPTRRLKPPIVPEPADVLERVRAGYALPAAEHPTIDRELSWYARHQGYLDRTFERARPYLHYIVGEVESRGIPLEIALLPIVESAFDPFAYSHGRAAGLWQIIPGTGKRFGLKQNWWYDGRRDVIDSTRAALDYLEYLHDFFDGDWLLAVAAYNSGEGNVRRAIARNLRAGKPTDFFSLSLPRETRAYVPRLLAISRLVADPEGHGVTLPAIEDRPTFRVVPVEGQLDLALAADLAGIEVDDLYALNPGFNRWATDPDGPARLVLPIERADVFETALASLDRRQQVEWERYRVRNGDALLTIARRFGTTVDVIREANDLRGNTIRAGSYLMVPKAVKSLDAYTLSADARLERKQSVPRGDSRIEHRVRRGESFWTISRRYGVGVRQLAAWNGMAPGDTLSVGRTLVVWQKNADASAGRIVPATNVQPPGRVRKVNYTVRRGDSLWSISNRFSVSVAQLKNWNGLGANTLLRPGQRLVMYVDVTRQTS